MIRARQQQHCLFGRGGLTSKGLTWLLYVDSIPLVNEGEAYRPLGGGPCAYMGPSIRDTRNPQRIRVVTRKDPTGSILPVVPSTT